MDLSHFDLAHFAGHEALHNLCVAYRLYTIPIDQALSENGITVDFMDFKETHDIQVVMASTRINQLDIDLIDPVNAFHLGTSFTQLRVIEAQLCIKAAIFFQVMMESDANDMLAKKDKDLSFYKKWRKLLKTNSRPSEEWAYFQSYFDNIYKKIRNETIHANQRHGLRDAENFRFPFVYKNLMHGWYSFVLLLNDKHNLSLDLQDNWAEMCNIHQIPGEIEDQSFPDISLLSHHLLDKHLTAMNSVNTDTAGTK